MRTSSAALLSGGDVVNTYTEAILVMPAWFFEVKELGLGAGRSAMGWHGRSWTFSERLRF